MRQMFVVLSALVMACSGEGPSEPRDFDDTAVASVIVYPTDECTWVGESFRMFALAADTDGKVVANPQISFSASDEGVASVDPNGTVRALAVGKATVTTSSGGKSAQTTVTVFSDSVSCLGGWDY